VTRVIFRDDDWLAVEKPSGVPTTAPPSAGVKSLVDLVRAGAGEGSEVVHPLSRLDVEVTGVVLFARTRAAIERARVAREAGRYERRYVALLVGAPEPPSGEWNWSIEVDRRDRRRRKVGEGSDAVTARTRYTTRAVANGCARVEMDLETGRTHQIRVHAQRAGCPVLGDRAYGGPRHVTLGDGTVITARRVMLHALWVEVPGTTRVVECEPPEDFEGVWRALARDT
jgi:23S rRNA pseudouridine1911/1915/1917 synthase